MNKSFVQTCLLRYEPEAFFSTRLVSPLLPVHDYPRLRGFLFPLSRPGSLRSVSQTLPKCVSLPFPYDFSGFLITYLEVVHFPLSDLPFLTTIGEGPRNEVRSFFPQL